MLIAYSTAGYLLLTANVSWKSSGEFSHLENVTTGERVVVDFPLEVELASDVYPEFGLRGDFESALKSSIREAFEERNISVEFAHVRPVIIMPGESPPDWIDEPVVVLFIPFQGHEDRFYYETCYASVLLYASSSGDVGSYLSVEEMYRGNTDNLEDFARELFQTAEARGDASGRPYSTLVVYWNTLEVRNGKLSGEDCWELLSREVVRELEAWAETLN
ncbi:hypothetical protein CL1_0185 [Thermococcus cleftensis]|uniref:Uncharacterized protein n=2 Tax=Thermococcaceae TaxID=2259 RepID=I3ZRR3_THECF|nr:hypothetical protein CL1_0185 [Thermococcus cleftensis]